MSISDKNSNKLSVVDVQIVNANKTFLKRMNSFTPTKSSYINHKKSYCNKENELLPQSRRNMIKKYQ